MGAEFTLKGRTKNYPILFTNLGVAQMERETSIKLPRLLTFVGQSFDAQKLKTKAAREAALAEIGLQVGVYEVLALLYAALEGHRQKFRTRPEPYTMDEASDIMDDCGGLVATSNGLGEAFQEYWPKLIGHTAPTTPPPGKPQASRSKRSRTT